MNQYMAISEIRKSIRSLIASCDDSNVTSQLQDIDQQLNYFLDRGIDFKEIVDEIDDGIFITDDKGTVLYVNPAYTQNTGIRPEQVLNRNIYDLIEKDGLYSGGAVPDVLESGKKAYRLSTTYATGKPLRGYAVGSPIFDADGNLRQVVACNRTFVTLRSLKEDYDTFVKEVQAAHPKNITQNTFIVESENMIGRETTLANIHTLITHVADTDATILITGESGAGKEVIADEIVRLSGRRNQPFIKINCTAIPANLIESELFGYEKGAFSGANTRGKPGLFELANHGTLLLDEIGDMPMDLQVKLLRAIQQQEITRIGGTKPIHLDIRFLALTNSDLKEKIAAGTFRQDLYYRLSVIPIHVPPLRERTADIRALCDHFIGVFCKKYDRSFVLSEQQYDMMQQYAWPGNIRELENIIEYLVLCSSGIGQVDDSVLTGLLNLSTEEETQVSTQTTAQPTDFNTAVANFEKQLLENTLKTCDNLREAGKKLNINASTISRKIKQYDIDYAGRKD